MIIGRKKGEERKRKGGGRGGEVEVLYHLGEGACGIYVFPVLQWDT